MQAHDGGEYSELQPSAGHLVILFSQHMSADIVAPESIADIGGGRRKIRLKIQGIPGYQSITGKAYGIPVAARTRISGKDHGTFFVPSVIQIMIVIEHPQRIHSLYTADPAGLPVNPPEVHAHLFLRMGEIFKIGPEKIGGCRVEIHRLSAFRINSHIPGHGFVDLFAGSYAICGMEIQCGVKPAPVKLLQKLFRMGKQLFVPGVAGPAASVFGIDICHMPVHIDYAYGEGDFLLLKPVHQLQIGFLGVWIEPAPPVAKGIPGDHGTAAAQKEKVFQGFLIIMSVTPEIQIRSLALSGFHPAVLS